MTSEQLINRLDNINDFRMAMFKINESEPNELVYKQSLIDMDLDSAEAILISLEAADAVETAQRASNAYKDLRAAAYPSISDQLDQQYHDMIDGTTVWKDSIQAIKTLYPKI